MKKHLFIIGLTLSISYQLSAQVAFSLGTGLSGLRNFSPQQKFWAFGQTVQANFHLAPKQTVYAWIDYYTVGKYRNNFTAFAKGPTTQPQQLNYTATGRLFYRQFSVGFKHYFKGTFDAEKGVNIYGLAGFGYLFTKINNSTAVAIDTTLYSVSPKIGDGKLDRLTLDLGAGAELPLGGNFSLFAEARGYLPASGTESPYLHNQKNLPLSAVVSAGIRIIFGSTY